MQTSFYLFLFFTPLFASGHFFQENARETPQQALNQYVAFLNHSVDEVASRLQQLQTYYADTESYRAHSTRSPRLSSSGPLEDHYYRQALTASALTDAERQRLQTDARNLWKLLTKLDQKGKALETYTRLRDYERDQFKKADSLITDLKTLTDQFSRDKQTFYKQIQRIYHRYQPYRATDAYLYTENELEQALENQQQLLDTLRYYLNENGPSDWPVELIQQSIRADEKMLSSFGAGKAHIDYPASDMVSSFRGALQSLQALKKQAVDNYTFAARQSTRHSNGFYRSFLNHYNNDLLSWHQSFVKYSASTKQVLDYPKFSPVFSITVSQQPREQPGQTLPFRDVPPVAFTTKPAPTSASTATFQTLTAYVDFINESLRQMNTLQLLLRDYQQSAESYRAPARSGWRQALTYAHEDYTVPVSEHQFLVMNSQHVPQPYRTSLTGQADVLLAMLKEMDGLSIELITYTGEKHYEQDHLQRSDAILDRYAYLFETFDQKKEQLYRDVRRVHESYPAKKSLSWIVAGRALLNLIDTSKDVLSGVKSYLRNDGSQLPATDKLTAEARTLIASEYQNLKGLRHYGRSNGLCPYTPYEDLAERSNRLADMVKKLPSSSSAQPYEAFYYFFNNELAYNYNKFCDLAKEGVLKTISEPNGFAFRRLTPQPSSPPPAPKTQPLSNALIATTKPVRTPTPVITRNTSPVSAAAPIQNGLMNRHDTVYVDRTKVDTVYIDRTVRTEAAPSLAGFAPNNMVLLLDVSASMNSPYKLPLLKKSIKSLLALLRPEDQLSIVIYSGKARVALKPTSGAGAGEIASVIDQLQSDGDTDGNGGIRLAYKLADKHYLRAGNNRIVLATDGEFSVSDEVYKSVQEASRQDIHLTIFTFGRKDVNSQNLKKLAQFGQGTYAHITPENADLQLILEAQAKKLP